jgi:SpoVK/Ycf46/Vps4 family AAA+-type ATPase
MNDLIITNGYKEIVTGLVALHFENKAIERDFDMPVGHQTMDIIQGKGRGLVILLHGVPGVGKTATAEAVASRYEKPLFSITCGDLGLQPKDVEDSLNGIFRLAHLWDCVLLLDEADVFLTQRSRLDIGRNALVSGKLSNPRIHVVWVPDTWDPSMNSFPARLGILQWHSVSHHKPRWHDR